MKKFHMDTSKNSDFFLRSRKPRADDCKDAGGSATQEAKAENRSHRALRVLHGVNEDSSTELTQTTSWMKEVGRRSKPKSRSEKKRIFRGAHIPVLSIALALLCSSPQSFADFFLQGGSGISSPEASGYDNSFYSSVSGGYNLNDWGFQVGFVYLGEFDLSDSSSEGSIESKGVFAEVSRAFDAGPIGFEIGLGLSAIESEARLEDKKVGQKDDTAPFLELSITKELFHNFDLRGGVNYFNDVSGSDITTFSAGIRYEF